MDFESKMSSKFLHFLPKILADLRLWMRAGVVVGILTITAPSSAATAAAVVVVVPASSEGRASADRRKADERVVVTLVEGRKYLKI